MAIKQHLHRFLLPFFGINTTLGPVLLASLHAALLGCWTLCPIDRPAGTKPQDVSDYSPLFTDNSR
jgi:hypothetical protein